MPEIAPGADRLQLDFAQTVEASFRFLVCQFRFRLVDMQPTFVRYEAEQAFVNIFHGRSSYELGIEIGRWVEVDGRLVEEKFTLGDVIALGHDLSAVGYRSYTATSKEQLVRSIAQLADWTQRFGSQALRGEPTVFDSLRAQGAQQSQTTLEGWRAQRLRAAASEAWRRKDWGRVIDAYSEMDAELGSVELKRSERARLNYAQKMLTRDDR